MDVYQAAPASNASCVLSTCSRTCGYRGVIRLAGTEPVMATAITMGFMGHHFSVATKVCIGGGTREVFAVVDGHQK